MYFLKHCGKMPIKKNLQIELPMPKIVHCSLALQNLVKNLLLMTEYFFFTQDIPIKAFIPMDLLSSFIPGNMLSIDSKKTLRKPNTRFLTTIRVVSSILAGLKCFPFLKTKCN